MFSLQPPRHISTLTNSVRISATEGIDAKCQNVWPGRAVQDGFPRATNVRAASMYQVSSWSIFCSGPSWVSARIQAD